MPTIRGRAPLSMRHAILLALMAMIVMAAMLASCNSGGGDTPPPPTIIRADETLPPGGPTATPTSTPTATPGAGYPLPAPAEPTTAGYPAKPATPEPTPYPG